RSPRTAGVLPRPRLGRPGPQRRQLADPVPAYGRLPAAEDRLAPAPALVLAIPGPAAALVGVHELQAADALAVELDGHVQVGPGRGDLDDLDERAVEQRGLRAR